MTCKRLLFPVAVASASPLCTTCQHPVHSWKTLPVSFHSSKRASDDHGGFAPEELDVIKRFPLVTIEKWQGDKASLFIWEEDAMTYAASQVKNANPNASVVVWFDSVRVYTGWNWPFKPNSDANVNHTFNPDAKHNCATGHFRHGEFLEAHPEYLLKNASGQPAVEEWSGCHTYDFAQEKVRNFWRDMCLNMTASGIVDGCGADDAWDVDVQCDMFGLDVETCDTWRAGHRQMMNETAEALGDGLLIGKDALQLGEYVNAVLHEGCDASNATILSLRGLTQRAKAAGQHWVYQCHSSCTEYIGTKYACSDSMESQVAAFLIGAGEDHYFSTGIWDTAQKTETHWLPEFFEPTLGDPLADAEYNATSGDWLRSFSSGTQVRFNAVTNEGVVQWASSAVLV